MSLPINIKDMIHGHSVECERYKRTSPNQRYKITASGKKLLNLIK